MALIQRGDSYQFGNESELEELVWKQLPALLNLKPFKRQFSIRGQFCDILAVDEQRQLSIIELKNTEDRYVIQQLTRYYDALRHENPFNTEVDLEQPIRLIAIAPSFHQDTLIDCKYTALNIELIQFKIDIKDNGLHLVFIDLSKPSPDRLSSVVIQHDTSVIKPDFPIPDPPRKLLNWLSHSSEQEFDAVTTLRKRLLSFDPRMKEMVDTESIFYGKSKSNLCCEIRKQKKTEADWTGRRVLIFLWLPSPEVNSQSRIWRMYIHPNKDGILVDLIAYCPRRIEIKEPMLRLPGFFRGSGNYRGTIVDAYQAILDESFNCSLENLTNLALQTWHRKL